MLYILYSHRVANRVSVHLRMYYHFETPKCSVFCCNWGTYIMISIFVISSMYIFPRFCFHPWHNEFHYLQLVPNAVPNKCFSYRSLTCFAPMSGRKPILPGRHHNTLSFSRRQKLQFRQSACLAQQSFPLLTTIAHPGSKALRSYDAAIILLIIGPP